METGHSKGGGSLTKDVILIDQEGGGGLRVPSITTRGPRESTSNILPPLPPSVPNLEYPRVYPFY